MMTTYPVNLHIARVGLMVKPTVPEKLENVTRNRHLMCSDRKRQDTVEDKVTEW